MESDFDLEAADMRQVFELQADAHPTETWFDDFARTHCPEGA
jgi:hypothetical protein